MRPRVQKAFEDRDWSSGGKWPVSGHGSTMESTERLRKALPDLFEKYNVKTFVDAPCGDWHWMQHVNLKGIEYIGADVSSKIVDANQKNFAGKGRSFLHLDITSDPLPDGDIFLCRDCLFHLKTWLRWEFFRNFAKSNNRYLLTTAVQTPTNRNLPVNGKFAAFNPFAEPYNFPKPYAIIPESTDNLTIEDMSKEVDSFRHRAACLWSRNQIADAVKAFDAAQPAITAE